MIEDETFDELLDLARKMVEALYEFKCEDADYYNGQLQQLQLQRLFEKSLLEREMKG
jgi:hypothetical protein